jgi:hypothetical protein
VPPRASDSNPWAGIPAAVSSSSSVASAPRSASATLYSENPRPQQQQQKPRVLPADDVQARQVCDVH